MQAAGSFPTFRSLIVRNRARQSPSTFLADFEHEVKSALAEAATPDEGRDLRVAYCLLFHKICTFAVPSRNAKQKCGWSIGNGAELNALFVMRSPLYRQTLEWTRFIEWLSAQGAGPVSTLSVQQPDMVIAARSERDWTSAEAESNQQYRQGLVAATARQRAIRQSHSSTSRSSSNDTLSTSDGPRHLATCVTRVYSIVRSCIRSARV